MIKNARESKDNIDFGIQGTVMQPQPKPKDENEQIEEFFEKSGQDVVLFRNRIRHSGGRVFRQ